MQLTLDTALYYTLSTVAQALAGAIALLAAFALYRLAAMDANLREGAVCADAAFGDDGIIRANAVGSNYAFLAGLLTQRLADDAEARTRMSPVQVGAISRLMTDAPLRMQTVRAIRTAIPLVLATMATAVGLLALVPVISRSEGAAWFVLVVAVVAFSGCLWLLGKLLRLLLQ